MAVKKAAKIVVALKSFSRIESIEEKQLTSIAQSIEIVLTLYHNQLKMGTEIVKNFDRDIKVMAFSDELQQVWANLIHNSLQSMKFKGVLTLGIKQVGKEVEVSIQDSGSGIPEEIKPKIFEAFFTTKPAGEGTGLGLDIVKRIVEKHKGTISFESQEGVGTTFFVRIPLEEKII
jgi:signal transduction histidine kinase